VSIAEAVDPPSTWGALTRGAASVPAAPAPRSVHGMDDLSTPLGIALIVIGAFVALKAAKAVIKLAMLAIIVIGVYLWFAAG